MELFYLLLFYILWERDYLQFALWAHYRCRRDVWVASPPPPVLGIHWSAGVGKIIESLTVVLGEPSGWRVCHGGGCQPAARCRSHDVESSNTGAIRDGVTSDVVGDDEYWRRTCSVSCGRNSEVIHDSEGAASGQIHGSNGPVAPSVGFCPGAPGPVPTSSCTSCMRCEYCFPRREPPVQ